MKPGTLAALAALIGGLLLIIDLPTPGPTPTPITDVLGQCHTADRASKARILLEMADKEFADDAEQAEWWNSEVDAARAEDMQPFVDQLSEAIVAGTVRELGESLK